MSTLPKRLSALKAALLLLLVLLPGTARAVAEGIVIIDQSALTEPVEWGLTTPSGFVKGRQEFSTHPGNMGRYSLSVREPEGKVLHFSVYSSGKFTGSSRSTGVTGILTPGGELRFELLPSPESGGSIIRIRSTPEGVYGYLKGPEGTKLFSTPARFTDMTDGEYTVYYQLSRACPPTRPISRWLEAEKGITFDLNVPPCALFATGELREKEPTAGTPPPTPPRRERIANGEATTPILNIALVAPSEIAAGGGTRLTATLRNVSDLTLRNLQIDLQYDGSLLQFDEAGVALVRPSVLTWRIPELQPDGIWRESIAVTAVRDVPAGTITSVVATVHGNDLVTLPSPLRSTAQEIAILTELPQTGLPLDWYMMIAYITGALVILGTRIALLRPSGYGGQPSLREGWWVGRGSNPRPMA